MSFLAPLALLLAVGTAVPLLVHLLRRRPGARVEFPAARYLERAETEHRRTLRLRNWLLMAARVIAVAFVSLAAARPAANGEWIGAGHPPTALAIVIDNSLSSGAVAADRPLLERFTRAAAGLVEQASSGDRLWIVTADGVVTGGPPVELTRHLEGLAPLAGGGDLRRALTLARGVVRASGLETVQVALITDAQQSAWTEPLSRDGAPLAILIPADAPPPNHAAHSVAARPSRWTPRGSVVMRFLSTPADSVSYRVTLAGRAVARGTAAADGETIVAVAPQERGWVAGAVELEPDELTADNVRHFAVWIGAPVGVRVGAGAGPFVGSAVDALRESRRVAAGGNTDVAIVPADELNALPALVLPPRSAVQLGAANRALERAGIRWRFGERIATRGTATGDGLTDVSVAHRYQLRSTTGAADDTLARVDGKPWIVGGRDFVLVGSALVPEETSLPVRASFIPWLASVLTDRLSQSPGAVIEAAPGERILRPRWADAMVVRADTTVLTGDSITAPTFSGVSFLLARGQPSGALVVNAPAAESMLTRYSASDLAGRAGAPAETIYTDAARWASSAFRSTGRRPLTTAFLIAALAAVLVETVVIGFQRRAVTV
jgi:hypothetical protein